MAGESRSYRSETISAWRREHTVYLDTAGQREIALGEGKDVALAVSAKGSYVAWSDATGIQVHQPDGKTIFLSHGGGFPTLAALPHGKVLAAWEQDGAIKIRLLE